ncbi:MAG: Hydroxyacylglutathione hydrolase [Promethearchaeota archaeon]|nr:MAG: Hydroxyacylglutathione hydrolase [Candidatus Lokiarchaeota archaeon]
MLKDGSEVKRIEGVYRIKIPVPFAVKFVCVYLLPIKQGYILIDAGLNMGDWVKKFLSSLKQINVNLRDIKYCIVTHEHLDHIGLLENLKELNPSIKIVMHHFTNEILKWECDPENLEEIKQASEDLAKMMISYGIEKKYKDQIIKMFLYWRKIKEYVSPDIIISPSEGALNLEETKLKLIWTPGHSFGHICLFEPQKRILFSGDHILSRITPHIGNFIVNKKISDQFDFNNILKYYLESLGSIKELKSEIIFPAHQEVIHNPEKRIEEIFDHHQTRLSQIQNVIKDHPKTPYEISQEHFGTDLDETNTFLAVSEVLGHLIYLEEQQKINRVKKEDKIFFESII